MRVPEGRAPTSDQAGWRPDDFVASLVALSPHTRDAYAHDVAEFVAWAERGGCAGPGRPRPPDPAPLPRLPRHPRLRPLVDRPQGGRAPRLPALPEAPRGHRARPGPEPARPEGRQPPAPGDPVRRGDRPPRRRPGPRDRDDADDDDPVATAVVLRDLAVLEVLYGAGLRVAECCGLRVTDCDLDRGLVTVVGKGSKIRRVPLGEPAVDAVADWLARGRPVLADRRHRPATSCS